MTEHIGIYRVESRIGHGGMGEVFLAWDDRLERRVAIKRIRRDAGLSAEQRERFRREARLAARLSHSAVVQIYDLVTEEAEDALVMEYVEGRTLAERLTAGPLEIADALRLAQEIAQGLAAAHEAGLIHRDLKAANVIVTPAGHAKILDFGLARPVSRRPDEAPLTRQGFVIGTFHSMSPEQARGDELDQRSDLFSFGILLYEMLTGQAPFRAENPAETLRRIVQEPPPDPRALRPGLPAEVGPLLDRLLAKDRRDRPQSAGEVAAILERFRTGSGHFLPAADASVSDQPTSLVPKEPVPSLRPQNGAPPSSLVGPIGRSPRHLWTALATAVLIATVATTVFLEWPSRAPLRIAVSPIEVVPPDDERLALAGSGVVTAAISGLTALEGLAPIDPREASGRSPVAMARATAADEVLTGEIRREGPLARVTLRRLQGADGRVLWTETFPVPIDPGELRVLAGAVAMKVRDAWSDHDLRPGVPELDVRDQDYATFLEIKQRIAAGEVRVETELERLEEIARSSPRFLEARILAAQLARNLFVSRREIQFLDRASELARQAKELSPEDPRPLREELQIALSANRLDEARTILTRLERLLPGDPNLLPLRARLAEQEGRQDERIALLTTAVEQAPSWQNLYRLAQAEAENGRISEARSRIETILRQSPGNTWALEALGHLELFYGDLARAEQIYRELARSAPQRSLTNLGAALFFSERFQEAADTYRRALALEPDQIVILLNLADTESELGRTREAEALYRRGLSRLAENERAVGLTAAEAMFKAQCLARLGRFREAVELAQAQLRKTPDDPRLLQQSSLVHSLAGERTTALNNAMAALEKGVQPRWFAGSVFRWLRESPELRSRFAATPPY
jgi:eukaryotic-like serine/threonine-protein kinase